MEQFVMEQIAARPADFGADVLSIADALPANAWERPSLRQVQIVVAVVNDLVDAGKLIKTTRPGFPGYVYKINAEESSGN